MPRRRGKISNRYRTRLRITLAIMDERERELAEEAKILENNKKPFLKEYRKICRKYHCYVESLGVSFIHAVRKGEKIYTITDHLYGLK